MAEKVKKTAAPGAKTAASGPKTAAPKARAAAPRTRKAAAAKADGGVPVLSASNEKVGEVSLLPEVFGAKVNQHLIYEAVKQYRAGARAGTHMTKNRALVSGTGKKPWRQKGTGRARVGEARNPLWRHGGTVFGPVPRDYSYTMPKKARAAALRSALSQRVKEGALKVIESFPVQMPEKPPYRLTRQLQAILDKLEVAGKTVLVDHQPSDALLLSGRNVPGVRVVADSHLSVYDVLDCKNLLVSRTALGKLEERLSR